mgnify:CR=1 FL=1|tara:strand:+ start:944 stop:1138 length:195 start_codon:yes stop_codon:yes gene_type:complete
MVLIGIINNPILVNLDGLLEVSSVDYITIRTCDALISRTGLENISFATGFQVIETVHYKVFLSS